MHGDRHHGQAGGPVATGGGPHAPLGAVDGVASLSTARSAAPLLHASLPVEGERDGTLVATMRPQHLADAIRLFRANPETACQDWEDQALLLRHLELQPRCNWVAQRRGEVVGALIGGSVGVRATISHVAVRRDARQCGIATRMVRRALDAFEQQGIYRIYLFTQAANTAAIGLWTSLGFHGTAGETTLEVDLPAWSLDASPTG